MILTVSLFFIALYTLSVQAEEWSHNLVLDPEGKYHVRWTPTDHDVTFQVEVETRGWVGFGISPDGGMKGSDVIIGWVANYRSIFHDRYAPERTQPIIDEQQDWQFIWCCENDTHTSLRFRRPLDTHDSQDIRITDSTMWLIYAYNDEDPSSPTTVKYHGSRNRGTKPALILQAIEREDLADIQFWEVKSPNVLIPHNKDAPFVCTLFLPPRLNKKHHVIKIEPLIQKGNERFVRLAVLFRCSIVDEKVIYPYRLQEYTECFNEDQSSKFPFCTHVWTGWAVASGVFEFPDHVGMPIEESYYLLEVGYNNPNLEEGIYDNSGIRLTYTPDIRQYDSDILVIGSMWQPCFFIPPKGHFVTSGHAHSECLKKGIHQNGIKAFAVSLHTHSIGRMITVRHFRDSEELPPIIKDENYDIKNQEKRLLTKERTILPNDHLIVECSYDSSGRDQTTFGGLGMKEELCLASISYYPKSSLDSAMSCPSPKVVLGLLGVTKMSNNNQFLISPTTGRNESYINFFGNYLWSSDSLNAIQNVLADGPQISMCSIAGNVTVPSKETTRPKTGNLCGESCGGNRPSSTKRPQLQEPRPSRSPQGTARPQNQRTRLPGNQIRRKKVPQTIPYDLLEQIIIQLG